MLFNVYDLTLFMEMRMLTVEMSASKCHSNSTCIKVARRKSIFLRIFLGSVQENFIRMEPHVSFREIHDFKHRFFVGAKSAKFC